MKFCVNARNIEPTRKKADEIFIDLKDKDTIIDFIVKYPDKNFILEIKEMEFNEELRKFCLMIHSMTENFICQLDNLLEYNWFKENNIKFYYKFPVNSYFEIEGLIKLGVEYITIFQPLTFDMPNLKKYDVKFRMVPNVAYLPYIPRENGIKGQWVRPQDTKYYEDAIYVFDFETEHDMAREALLLDLYTKQEVWNGNLNLLITNLNYDTDNRVIPEELGERRSRCQQRCYTNKHCSFCEMALEYPQELMKYALEKEKEGT